MQRGDLSNKVAPRHVIVFEGGLASLPVANVPAYEKAYKKKRYWEAVFMWAWNTAMIGQIERLVRTTDINIEVCTWIGYDLPQHDFALAISDELDKMNIPVRSVWASSPFDLARSLAYLPDVACIYDPDPDHVLTFGSRGVHLTNPSQIGRGRT